jgi:NADH dehydrogenase
VERPARVLVLGGGFTAVHACRGMRRGIRSGELAVTVVTRDNFQVTHGLIGEMVTGRVSAGAIANPARRIFRPARVQIAEIESIDLESRTVVTSRSLDGARAELGYDHLVLSLGCSEALDAYPGVAEHAFRLKRFEDCIRLKNHILMMFELADAERDPEERRRLLTFFIAGGGFSGTELAGELADFARILTKKEFSGIRREECRVVVVHSGPTILPELYGASNLERPVKAYPRLVERATEHARALGVELMPNTRVAAATPHEVRLSDGRRVPTRTIISAVGTKPNPLVEGLPVEKDTRGRIVVDAFLRVKGRSEVWAGGDCASVPHPHGGTCAPVALYGLKHGRMIGANLERMTRGKALRPYRHDVKIQGVSIGRRTAVAEVAGIGFGGKGLAGKVAWVGWRSIIHGAMPSWDRRLRVLADWAIWPLVGRDITQVGDASQDDYEVEHYVFQAGEVMFEQRRPVRYIHVILEGSAEVLDAGGEPAGTLGAGDHFGRSWLQQQGGERVRATSLVRTVAFRADQGSRLQQVLAATGPLESPAARG